MLGNLDNSVIFKKAFTNLVVFKAFVRDILGIEVDVETIETERKFSPKIGFIDFELDIYAESKDKKIAIEIQKVEYDQHFDRFLHYFLMLIAEQQKSAKQYRIDQTVYVIVVLTAPYTISEKNGKPILDEFLLLDFNMQNIDGEIRNLYGHQFVCLNPNHPNESTPQKIRDWLDLIYQSIHNPERPALNTENEGIKKAIELIDYENFTNEERTASKNKEANRTVVATYRMLERIEIAKKCIEKGYPDEIIADLTSLSIEFIENLRQEINNKTNE